MSQFNRLTSFISRHTIDILIALCLGLFLASVSYQTAQRIPPVIFEDGNNSIWFESDTDRAYGVMTDKTFRHHLADAHPLFTIIVHPIVFVLHKALKLEYLTAVRTVIASVAFLWLSGMFILLRLLNCRRLDAVLFCLLGAVSASSVFWFSVIETFPFGSLSILLALIVAVLAQTQAFSFVSYIVLNVLTFSFVITNWSAGILVTLANNPIKKTISILACAFVLVTALWGVQEHIYHNSKFFIGNRGMSRFVFNESAGGPIQKIQSIFYHTVIMPTINVDNRYVERPHWPVLTTQQSAPGSASLFGKVGVIGWSILLLLGAWSIITLKYHGRFRFVLGLMILGQLCLHFIYGDETFLYSMHFLVLFIPLVALISLTKARLIAIILTALLIPFVAINNFKQFKKAVDFFNFHGSKQDQAQVQHYFRPHDPWPRGQEQVVVGLPESPAKAYHEAGGNFSPVAGSFGISIWVTDAQGHLLTTSENIPLENIQQRFINSEEHPIPSMETQTEHYEATWSLNEANKWTLDLKNKNPQNRLMVIVRGVGPAAGPIKTLDVSENTLSINQQWSIAANQPTTIYVGNERDQGWLTAVNTLNHLESPDGWGYAKLVLTADTSLVIQNTSKLSTTTEIAPIRSQLLLSGIDQQFIDSLNAQIWHLLMSTVGDESRMGDPLTYPLPRVQEEAYIIVALASAGQLPAAQKMANHLAQHDFFGPFGAEAVAPGLGIWALEEVANRLQQKEYDRFIWPHVVRKAKLIETMLSTNTSIYNEYENFLNPSLKEKFAENSFLTAEPAIDGLINGKADGGFPLLYVNAAGYLGLIKASELAERLDETSSAERWRALAAQLQDAWGQKFAEADIDDAYNYANSLWPSAIVTTHLTKYSENLAHRWAHQRDDNGNFKYEPSWSYFVASEAHQWLKLGDVDRTWKTLHWLWANQSSPGLYTWSEKDRPANPFSLWNSVRSTKKEGKTTPHYWTAAETALLQLDMLTMLTTTPDGETITIGAGIPKEWLANPIKVEGIQLSGRTVNWSWDGEKMSVTILGESAKVVLGPAFGPETPVVVDEAVNLLSAF